MTPDVPAADYYLTGFFVFGLPILVFMAGIGVVALKKRWKSAAIICGAVFLLTAASLLRDSRHRQQPKDRLVVQGAGLGCGLAGLALIILAVRFKPGRPGPPDASGMP